MPTTIIRDTRGLSMVEYLILLVVIAVASIGVWQGLGLTIIEQTNTSNQALQFKKVDAEEGAGDGIQERSDDFESGFGQ